MDTQNQSKSSWYVSSPIVAIDFHSMHGLAFHWDAMNSLPGTTGFAWKRAPGAAWMVWSPSPSIFGWEKTGGEGRQFFSFFSLGKSNKKSIFGNQCEVALHVFFQRWCLKWKVILWETLVFFSISHFRFLVVNLRPVLYLHKHSMSKIIPCETSQIQHLIYDTPQCRYWQFPIFVSATCTKSWSLLRQKKSYMQMLVVWIQSLKNTER